MSACLRRFREEHFLHDQQLEFAAPVSQRRRNAPADSRRRRRAPLIFPTAPLPPFAARSGPASRKSPPPQMLARSFSRAPASSSVRVARQAVRQHAHVRRAARIGVIAQRHVAHLAWQLRAERHEVARSPRRNFRAENDRDVRSASSAAFSATSCSTISRARLPFASAPASEPRPLPCPAGTCTNCVALRCSLMSRALSTKSREP